MKINFKYLLLFVTISLFSASCKKYPQGGKLYKSIKNLEGSWVTVYYRIDSKDTLDYVIKINKLLGSYYTNVIYFFGSSTKKNSFSCTPDYSVYRYDADFSSNKKYLKFTRTDYPKTNSSNGYQIFNPNESNESVTWQIMELTETELILRYFNSYSYELKLKKR